MERKLSFLFGIIGGFSLLTLNPPVNLSMALRGMRNELFNLIFTILSLVGVVVIIAFSILLIIEAIKTAFQK